jgi:hypothetical protein
MIEAIYSLIVSQPWMPRLAKYDFGDGELRPAVFTNDPPPADAEEPLIVIGQAGGNEEGEIATRGSLSASHQYVLRVYDKKSDSDKGLRAITNRLYELFFNGDGRKPSSYVVEGKVVEKIMVNVPTAVPDNEGFPGYIMTVTITATSERV